MKLVRVLRLFRLKFVANVHQLPHGLLLALPEGFGLVHMCLGVDVYLPLSFSGGVNRYFLKLPDRGAALSDHLACLFEDVACFLPEVFAVPVTTNVL